MTDTPMLLSHPGAHDSENLLVVNKNGKKIIMNIVSIQSMYSLCTKNQILYHKY